MERSSREVIRRVFEGGAGWVSGGREERLMESGVRGERVGDAVGEGGGSSSGAVMVIRFVLGISWNSGLMGLRDGLWSRL